MWWTVAELAALGAAGLIFRRVTRRYPENWAAIKRALLEPPEQP